MDTLRVRGVFTLQERSRCVNVKKCICKAIMRNMFCEFLTIDKPAYLVKKRERKKE